MNENDVKSLSQNFLQELQNIEIGPYNLNEVYDYSGCTDFLAVGSDSITCKIYDLLGLTSAMQLFEKYLSLGIYTIYDCAENFNLENFNVFSQNCRERGMALLWKVSSNDIDSLRMQQEAIDFFAPYKKFVISFIGNILQGVQEFSQRNHEVLEVLNEINNFEAENNFSFDTDNDEAPGMEKSSSCPSLNDL